LNVFIVGNSVFMIPTYGVMMALLYAETYS